MLMWDEVLGSLGCGLDWVGLLGWRGVGGWIENGW